MQNPYPITSRYYGLEVSTREMADGRSVAYLRRRFAPSPERFATLEEHAMAEGERVDHIAARFLGDPEAFWRVCDANNVMKPEELELVGRVIRITLPEGIPGPTGG
ncbi:MAG TPA: LysM domain-containing protein [Armatimonadota bacterium]|jgi:hypothetical protein